MSFLIDSRSIKRISAFKYLSLNATSMKTALVGLDGATFDVIEPWMDEGHLPNMKALIKNGVSGRLKSTIPPVTMPAFPSLYTGMKPENMGAFGWKEFDMEENMIRRVDISKIKGKRLWHILSENRRRSIWLNIPTTYPPQKFDGCMVTGLTTPDINSDFTHPKGLKDEIFDNFPDYQIHPSFYYEEEKEDQYLEEIESLLEKRFKLAKYLWKNKEWDTFIMLFRSPDNVFHFVWPEGKKEEKVLKIHKQLDEYLGWFRKQDVNIILFSDHGFTQNRYQINTNHILKDNGLLTLKKNSSEPRLKQRFLAWFKQKTKEFVRKHDLMWLVKKYFSQDFIDKIPDSPTPSILDSVDWSKSKAVSTRDAKIAKIYLNSEIDKRDQTISALQNIFKEVSTELEVDMDFIKPSEGPALIVICNQKYWNFSSDLEAQETVTEQKSADHDHYGIFVANGPDFTSGQIDGARLYDLGPTLLHLYNIPIPSNMDGKVLTEIFSSKSEASTREPEVEKPKDEALSKAIGKLKDSGKI